jgi:diaminohydroxyphosphoribosylaminopyrimidine deaminase / 5-amino-6-(5-phosphoribosylamino)uracil reductase
MRRCIELAKKGEGNVAPNPMVGSVIVYNGQIIGEGFHQKYGEAHAEVNAINSVKDKSLLKQSTIYVNLEPCAHHGKTPPCSDLIITNKIPHVVIGSKDTFSKVNGKGIERLKQNGVEVDTGVLEKECRFLNKRFFTFHEQKRPYVILKWAQTRDGFIDKKRGRNEKGVNWISTPETRSLVHSWRSHEMGILVGRKTIENDNPKLNVRDVHGNNPIRIILDPNLKLKLDEKSGNDIAKTYIINTLLSEKHDEIEWVQLKDMGISAILEAIWELTIQSIMVEGGSHTLQQFIDSNAWDEIRIIEGESFFKEGLKAPIIDLQPTKKMQFGKDNIYYYQK